MTPMHLTRKIRINPTAEQAQILWVLSENVASSITILSLNDATTGIRFVLNLQTNALQLPIFNNKTLCRNSKNNTPNTNGFTPRFYK
jgi:hypothetical protein